MTKRIISAFSTIAISACANAQLLQSWSAPPFDDGNPIPNFVDSWLTDISTGGFAEVPTNLGARALAADNQLGRVYASSGTSLLAFAFTDDGALTRISGPVRIRDLSGKAAESGQVMALGFASGLLYASVVRGDADAARDRGIESGFYSIDPLTATATLLRTPAQVPLSPGIDYNPDDQRMYAIVGPSPQTLIRFDLTTFTVVQAAAVPASAYNGVDVAFDGLAVGGGKVYLTTGLNTSYGNVPIAVFDIASATFEQGLQNPPRTAENRFYGSGATFLAPATPPSDPADFNGDVSVDLFDILEFVAAIGDGDLSADVNGDERLDIFDLLAFTAAFGAR